MNLSISCFGARDNPQSLKKNKNASQLSGYNSIGISLIESHLLLLKVSFTQPRVSYDWGHYHSQTQLNLFLLKKEARKR